MENLMEMFPHARMFILVTVLCFMTVAVANIIDCLDAAITSRCAGQEIESAKLRHALWKLAKEWILLIAIGMVDTLLAICWTKLPFVLMVFSLTMVGVEILSMVEHAKLRRDKLTKLPSALKEIVAYFGEEELKGLLTEYLKRKVIR